MSIKYFKIIHLKQSPYEHLTLQEAVAAKSCCLRTDNGVCCLWYCLKAEVTNQKGPSSQMGKEHSHAGSVTATEVGSQFLLKGNEDVWTPTSSLPALELEPFFLGQARKHTCR